MILKKHHYIIFTVTLLIGLCRSEAMAESLRDRILSEINVSNGGEYSIIKITFDFPVQYLRHTPPNYGKEVRIRLRPILANREELEGLNKRETMDPPKNNAAGVIRVEYDGRDQSEPILTVFFDKAKQFEAKQGDDFRSLIVQVPVEKGKGLTGEEEAAAASQEKEKRQEPAAAVKDPARPKPAPLSLERQESLLKEGVEAMAQKNYMRAVQIYTKLLESTDPAIQESVQYQLALAQELAGHQALAKAEYKNYMKVFPNGPNFNQAHDRYKALLTARPLREGETAETASIWKSEFFGSISEFYYRDSSFLRDEKNEEGLQEMVNVSSLTTGIDATWRMRSDKYQMETVAVGSYEGDLTGERENRTRTSALYFDFKDLDKTFATRWGRQSGNSGGVLGRFDGGKLSYLLTKKIRMNLVSGFPVARSYDDLLNTDKIFYGVNFDFGRFFDHWDFNTYVINQTADGIDDRRAVGTEVRYVDKQGSFFSLIDYDILFNELGIFIFAGNWLLPNDATRLNLSVDYRNNPILSTSNALIGQVSPSLEELKDSIGESALQKLAEDRTLRSSFVTLGASHTLSENLQFAGDVSWSKLDGAPASGGVEAMASTGDEFFYSTQVISNNFFRDGDMSTLGLRYADTKQRDTYSLILSSRQPIDDKWRLTPRLKIDYRDNKLQDGEQWRFRPALRAEYFFNKQWRLELEAEYNVADKELAGIAEDKSGYILSFGLRWNF
jgi:TolA-binding protein